MSLLYKEEKYDLAFQEFFPPFFAYQWASSGFYEGFKRLSGFTYKAVVYFRRGVQLEKFIATNEVKMKVRELANKKRDLPEFFFKQGEDYKKRLKSLEKKIKNISRTQLYGLTNDEIAKIFLDLHTEIEPYNAFSNFYYVMSLELEALLRENWKDCNLDDIQETITAMAKPYYPNASTRFSNALQAARYNYLKGKRSKGCLLKEAKKLARSFYWFTSISSITRSPESFIEDIKKVELNSGSHSQSLIKLPVPKGWEAAISVALYVKDDISTYFIPWYWHTLTNLWDSICERIGLHNRQDLWLFTHPEIVELLHSKVFVTEQQISERKSGVVLEEDEGVVKMYVGKPAEDFFHSILDKSVLNDVTEVKGNPAFPGNIQAKARIILERGQFSTFKEGEVLITPYTAPEFVPLMQKAAAIVTDTGGITSHAAIVSRELKKPCVVGTKIATQIFKDGDLVEIDAGKGIVKKLFQF